MALGTRDIQILYYLLFIYRYTVVPADTHKTIKKKTLLVRPVLTYVVACAGTTAYVVVCAGATVYLHIYK